MSRIFHRLIPLAVDVIDEAAVPRVVLDALRVREKAHALRAADWLSLGAAPTLIFMATLTAILDGGEHEVFCSAASHTSALGGMAPMYMMMSVFHLVPWLKLITRWRNGARAVNG
jgi:hypothetical protein